MNVGLRWVFVYFHLAVTSAMLVVFILFLRRDRGSQQELPLRPLKKAGHPCQDSNALVHKIQDLPIRHR